MHKERGLKDYGIMSKAACKRPLNQREELRSNKMISKSCYRVERPLVPSSAGLVFSDVVIVDARRFRTSKMMKAICLNLPKAANEVMSVTT